VDLNEFYLAFDLEKDDCSGRIQVTMGFWVRSGFEETIQQLSSKISETEETVDPVHYLNRARMYMAIGKSSQAKQDLNSYIAGNQGDARVYVNRAGTRFPDDLQGVLQDCNKAIELDPAYKNAYFLRGMATSALGNHEQACKDYYRAIELGFTVLKEAEMERCSEYWDSYRKE
jgi:Tfp pilus assembly protein PilF